MKDSTNEGSEQVKNTTPRTDYIKAFEKELSDINKLESTPQTIKNQAISTLTSVLQIKELNNTARGRISNSKQALENIGEGSMKSNFKVIYAQMCVLAISSLEATLKKYFENLLRDPRNINKENRKFKDLKVSLSDLLENNLKYSGKFGHLVLDKANLNFQDLQAIKRNFEEYTTKKITLSMDKQKKICFYLEVRHVLVHKGGIIDEKFVNSTENFGANIKSHKVGDHVELDSKDWAEIKKVLTDLVTSLTTYDPKPAEK